MPSTNQVSRRRFLETTSAAALSAGVWTSRTAAESRSVNQKLNIGCIGTANRAAANIQGVSSEKIVAICDIDKNYLDRAANQFPEARPFADYREMLDQMGASLDAVVVATADHHHG